MTWKAENEIVTDPPRTCHKSPVPPELVKPLLDCRLAASKASASQYRSVDKLFARPSGIRHVSGVPDILEAL
jgi:hypothetical protein